MSEFYDFFWGTAETNRNFDINIETTDTPLARSVALESFRSLVLARPDAGNSKLSYSQFSSLLLLLLFVSVFFEQTYLLWLFRQPRTKSLITAGKIL